MLGLFLFAVIWIVGGAFLLAIVGTAIAIPVALFWTILAPFAIYLLF